MWGNTIAIYSVLKKKTTKLNSQLTQYLKNKIDKDNFEKNHNNHVGKHCSNPKCFKEKNYKAKFLILKK